MTLPPLHPRCRCAIIYREEKSKPRDLYRPTTNQGAFAHLEVPMQLRAVKRLCYDYGIDIAGIRIKIQRDETMLKLDFAGWSDPKRIGRIVLFPNAFLNEEQLLKTVMHESCHVKQIRKYGATFVQENSFVMERVARRYEDFFWQTVRRRVRR